VNGLGDGQTRRTAGHQIARPPLGTDFAKAGCRDEHSPPEAGCAEGRLDGI